MREAICVIAYAAHGVLARWLNIRLCRYIRWEIAGPPGLEYRFRFYPDLPREWCLNLDQHFPGAWTHSRRVTALMWLLAAILGPIWDTLLLIHLTAIGEWLTDRKTRGAWRDA